MRRTLLYGRVFRIMRQIFDLPQLPLSLYYYHIIIPSVLQRYYKITTLEYTLAQTLVLRFAFASAKLKQEMNCKKRPNILFANQVQ